MTSHQPKRMNLIAQLALQKEYYRRLESVRYLQQALEAQQHGLFEFISANQADFNQLFLSIRDEGSA